MQDSSSRSPKAQGILSVLLSIRAHSPIPLRALLIDLDKNLVPTLSISLLTYYLLILGGHQYSIDGVVMFQAARTLWQQHSLHFSPVLQWGAPIYTSKYGPGMTLAYLPLMFAFSLVRPALLDVSWDPTLAYDFRLLHTQLYFYSSILNPIIATLIGVVVYFLARELRLSLRWSVLAALATGMASPLAVYARLDFAQPLDTLCLVSAIWLIVRGVRQQRVRHFAAAGICIGYGILTRFDFLLFLPWLLGVALLTDRNEDIDRSDRLRRVFALTVPSAAGMFLYLASNVIKFGSPLNFGYNLAFGLDTLLVSLPGFLVSPGRGILLFFPLSWLMIPGLMTLDRQNRVLALALAGIIGTEFLYFGIWDIWWGGWSWGPRFLLPLVPLIAILACLWAAASTQVGAAGQRRRRILFGILFVVGVIVSLNGILFDFLQFYLNYYGNVVKVGERASDQFWLIGSPLFAGWNFSTDSNKYDLVWLTNFGFQHWKRSLFVGGLLVSAVASGIQLTRQLRRNPQ